mgnify:CR=1 FL=1|tara:strand:+ start:26333 stop:27019 length:687 start_codon:yes stop_codon:yes gene_type:complete
MLNQESLNSQNLELVIRKISNLDYFIFFGTLLSFVRNDQLITRDDDIDIMLNLNEKEKLINELNDTELTISLNTKYFCQYFSSLDLEKKYPIDFYFYEEISDKHLVDHWNFFGWEGKKIKKRHQMYINKEHIYPLNQVSFQDLFINVPNNSIEVCKYLYGPNWKTPLSKNKEYFILILRNKPVVFYNKKIIKFLYITSLFLNKKFKKGFKNIYYLIPEKFRKVLRNKT